VVLTPHSPTAPSPTVTEQRLHALADVPAAVPGRPRRPVDDGRVERPAPGERPDRRPLDPGVGHVLVVDVEERTDPGDEAPCSTLLAGHLARRAASVAVLDGTTAPPHRPDLVIGFTPPLEDARIAHRAAREAGARLIVVVQELLQRATYTLSDVEAERRVLRDADVVAIASETFRDAVRGYGVPDGRIGVLPDWAHVVPTWLDRRDARRALGWPQRGFLAVHAGMGPHHDPECVVEAARLAGPDVQVALVGAGPRDARVRELAAGLPNVIVAGPLDRRTRPLSLVAADVLVLTEALAPGQLSLPGELASSLAAARPVVAAAEPGSVVRAELRRAGGAGVVVPAHSALRLAEALVALRAEPTRRVAMGLAGLAHAEAELSVEGSLARFDALVDAALRRPPVAAR